MLSLEEEELRQLQREVAAKRSESRGFNRYRDVMQQTLKKLKREVAQLREVMNEYDDIVIEQLVVYPDGDSHWLDLVGEYRRVRGASEKPTARQPQDTWFLADAG